VVLDAAVLLAAGWDDIVHEVWTTVIPADEVVPLHCCLNSVCNYPVTQVHLVFTSVYILYVE